MSDLFHIMLRLQDTFDTYRNTRLSNDPYTKEEGEIRITHLQEHVIGELYLEPVKQEPSA